MAGRNPFYKDGYVPHPLEIKALREKHGLSQRHAARLIWLAPRTFEAYEQGRQELHPALWFAFKKRLIDGRTRVVDGRSGKMRRVEKVGA